MENQCSLKRCTVCSSNLCLFQFVRHNNFLFSSETLVKMTNERLDLAFIQQQFQSLPDKERPVIFK